MRRLRRFSLLLATAALTAVCPVLMPGDAASATPALASPSAPVCGVADPASMSAPAQPPPANAFNVVAQGFSASALVVSSSTLYVLDVNTRTLRRLSLDGALLGSFSVEWGMGAPSLAVDDAGNIYLGRWPSTLVKLSPTGTELWAIVLPAGINGVYGIGTGAAFRVGAVIGTQPGSSQYNSDGVATGSSAITGTAFSPAPDGGIVTTDDRYVRRYSGTGVEQAKFGDPRGVNDMQFSGGPYHFFQQGGAAVDASGNFYVPDATRGIHGVTPPGYYRGAVADLTAGYVTERAWIAPAVTATGERRFYFAAGGRFNPNQNVSWVKEADLAALVGAPSSPKNRVLGFGAGLTSSAVGQYFAAGTTPSVRATFDPWWVSRAGGLSLRYTVRDRAQTVNQQAVAATTVPLPTTQEGLASVPLTLPPAKPGAYEVDARLVDSTGAVVGATCYRYAVGAAGHRLDFATLPPGTGYGGPAPRRGVALARQLGISALRSTADWERLLPNGPGSTMDFSVHDVAFTAAAQEATAQGVAFFVQLGSGLAREQQLVADGTWGARVKELVKHYHDAGVQISGWEVWSEPNNNFGPAPDYVTKALAPAFQAIREGDPDSKVIGATVLGMDLGYYEALGEAGAYTKMDVVGMHPYTGHNRSIEEQGIPQNIRDLQTILARYGATDKPLWNTEMAWWSDGPGNYFQQADKAARTLLWNRILGVERWSYLLLEAGYGDFGLTYSFIEAADSPDYVKAAALGTMTADWQTADRPLAGVVETAIPHTYAARFGSRPGGTDSVLAAWTDDVDVTATLVVTSSASSVDVTVTDVLGDASTRSLVPGQPSPIALGGGPVYVIAPAGAQLSLTAPTTFGTNLAAAAAGATATATSDTTTNRAAKAIDGLPAARLARTSSVDPSEGGNVNGIPAWASAPGDNTPSLTVQLPQAAELDRVVVLTHSNGSISPGLRNYSLDVRGLDGVWTTVGSVQDQFFDRGMLFSFAARTATALRITVSAVNYGGYAGGAAPWFWPTDVPSLSNPDEIWYGPAVVYEVEAYGPGAGPPPPPPPVAPTGLSAIAVSSTRVDLSWTASSGAASYKVERSTDNVSFAPLATGVTTTTHSDTTVVGSTTYYYRVKATNSAGDSGPSNTATATTPPSEGSPPPSPTGLEVGGRSDTQINIKWNASSGATSYKVERSTDNIAFTERGSTIEMFWADLGLTPGTTYHYRVRATNQFGDSAPSSTVSVTTSGGSPPPSPPAAPTGLSATATAHNRVDLSWTASSGATSYKVERSTDNVSFAPLATGVTTTTHSDTTVVGSTTYYYRVKATNSAGDSGPSNTATATTPTPPAAPPPAPTGLTVTGTTATQVSLSWTASAGATGYKVERSTDGASFTVVNSVGSTTYTDTGLSRQSTYYYRVRASNASGDSSPSNTVSARTKRK